MPVDPLTDLQRSKALRLGRGVPGGAGALPQLGAPDPTPRPPVGLPRLHPLIQAQDVTTPRPIASNFPVTYHRPGDVGRGQALMRRGFMNIVQDDINLQQGKVGPGVKKTLNLLKNQPDKLLDPKNAKHLDLAMNAGPNLQRMIDFDPQTSLHQKVIAAHTGSPIVRSLGPQAATPSLTQPPVDPARLGKLAQSLHSSVGAAKMDLSTWVKQNKSKIASLDPADQKQLSTLIDMAQYTSKRKNIAAGRAMEAGLAPPLQKIYGNDILSNAAAQAFEMGTGFVPGVYKLATQNPIKSAKEIGSQYSQYYGPLSHGQWGKFAHNVGQKPLTLALDASMVGGATIGTAGRVAAVSDAVKAADVAAATEDLGNNVTRVGGRYDVQPSGGDVTRVGNGWEVQPPGRYSVHDTQTGVKTAENFPDEASAIEHAKSLGLEGAHRNMFGQVVHAFTHPEMYGHTRGSWLDWAANQGKSKVGVLQKYADKAQAARTAENIKLADQIKEVADDPNLDTSGLFTKGGVKRDVAQARADFSRTKSEIMGNVKGLKAGPLSAQAYREIISGIRHGAIYARLGYLPNNWAGNAFMNLVHQGFLAPVNLAKSIVVYKHMDPTNLAMMRKATGWNPAQIAAEASPRGLITSLARPGVERMGALADQPFRDAAFLHEARRQGYSSISDVDKLFTEARGTGDAAQAARMKIANMGNRAQEEIVKFRDLNPAERAMAANGLFVWNWIRGSARYTARFPLQHPVQAAAMAHTAPIGQHWVDQQTGGLPWFMAGSIPVGHDKDGNPIMVNPFALNPLGSGLQTAHEVGGTVKAFLNGDKFNKYTDPTGIDATNPFIQYAIKKMTGQHATLQKDILMQLAPYRLVHYLKHPGSGSIYPMSRTEALGQWTFGSLYPRKASQQAITTTLERENMNNPTALLPLQVKRYEKATGQQVPPAMVTKIMGDMDAMQHVKDFQRSYADKHGASGYKKMSAGDHLRAGVEYLQQHPPPHMDQAAIDRWAQQYNDIATKPGMSDAVLESLANSVWGMTGVGQYKRMWDGMLRTTKSKTLTPLAK